MLADLLHVHSDYDDTEISSEPYTCIEAGTDHVDAAPLEITINIICQVMKIDRIFIFIRHVRHFSYFESIIIYIQISIFLPLYFLGVFL